ncbi:MAG: transcription factor [Halobacteria archaeon]
MATPAAPATRARGPPQSPVSARPPSAAVPRSLQDPALVEYLRRTVQPDGVRVLNSLAGAGEGTDEKISELSGVNLYMVRKILYVLYEMRLTEYRRQRNEENGWLTYHWAVNWREMEAHLAREVRKLARSLRTRLEHERDNLFYSCPQEGSRLLFDAASEAQFRCPSCGATLQAVDNRPLVSAMEARLDELTQAWPRALDGED